MSAPTMPTRINKYCAGCAIWFAARGAGLVDGQPYQSPCRVLLSGMGIDEQLGGYARHRSVELNNDDRGI